MLISTGIGLTTRTARLEMPSMSGQTNVVLKIVTFVKSEGFHVNSAPQATTKSTLPTLMTISVYPVMTPTAMSATTHGIRMK
jgi:hypothetical protein